MLAGCGEQTEAATRADGAGETTNSAQLTQVSASDLKTAVGNSSAQTFYDSVGWQAEWSDGAEQQLKQALANRAKNGLDRVNFLDQSGSSPAQREAGLTNAALSYASALARGLVDPNELHDIYTIPRPDPQLATGLRDALKNGRVDEWFASLVPQDREYGALSDTYQRLRKAAKDQHDISISDGDLIHQGESDSRIPQIARALARAGYVNRASTSGNIYDSRMEQAIRMLQDDRGIHVDGVIGSETVKALNVGADDRARAAAVALERRRWLQRNAASNRIDVNTAAAEMTYFRDGNSASNRIVIVGQPGWETPQLEAKFYRLVANPTWTVPKSIERQEGLDNKGASYLRSKNMVRKDGYIVQQPGPNNALGLVKFDMDDDYAIYLHDTEAKSLFGRDVRQLSHGCIRVKNALDFASTIAKDEGITSKWQQARHTGDETFLRLPNSIPVRLMYHPTYLDSSGEVRFVQDIYGWNDPIADKLGFGASSAKRRIVRVDDIGP